MILEYEFYNEDDELINFEYSCCPSSEEIATYFNEEYGMKMDKWDVEEFEDKGILNIDKLEEDSDYYDYMFKKQKKYAYKEFQDIDFN